MWLKTQEGDQIQWNGSRIIMTKRIPQLPLITIQQFKQQNAYIIPDGQEHKTYTQVEKILQFLLQNQCNRNSIVNIKGGGMALDIGGFASSIFMRGIQCNYIPTTLLSMVDASVGGKTGINFMGKNTIGIIKQPLNIFINTEYLKTLERRQLMNGMAQVIKMAFVYDKQFFCWLQQLNKDKLLQTQNIQYIIKKSIQLKLKVVQKDINEKHQRKWLNFGHTIGHGLQFMLQPQLKHGECVSIGMVLANKISLQLGLMQSETHAVQLIQLLQKFELPTKLPNNINSNQCLNLMLKDKKQINKNQINFVLTHEIGKPCNQVTPVTIQLLNRKIFNQPVSIGQQKQSKQVSLNQYLFPTSKSLSLRYLYAAALKIYFGSPEIKIINCLKSDDINDMINSLRNLGYEISINENSITVHSLSLTNNSKIFVGNSGLTARFLLPFCCLLNKKVLIQCDQRMQLRPNKELFKLVEIMGSKIQYLKNPYCFPVIIHPSQIKIPQQIQINGKQSSQYLSSFLFLSLLNKMPAIKVNNLQSQMVSESFVKMTISTLKQFGVKIKSSQNIFQQQQLSNNQNINNVFQIQPDYAGLSYIYIHRLINNRSLPMILQQSVQGDAIFYQYVKEVLNTTQDYLQLNFNNCTDTFMTMLVLVICMKKQKFKLRITNIANQRKKQSNRINAMITNIRKIATITQQEDGILIEGGINQIKIRKVQYILFQSFNDHRVSMSMAVLCSYLKSKFPHKYFIVNQPDSVNKTFPLFWKWLKSQNTQISSDIPKSINILTQKKPLSYYLIGMRGCGKTTYAQALASSLNLKFYQMDKICVDKINSQFKCQNIQQLVQKHGWESFRKIETQVLKSMVKQQNVIVATGGGIVQKQLNRHILQRQQCIYIQKRFEDLIIQETQNRPDLLQYVNFVFQKRQKHYLNLSKTIITFNQGQKQENINFFISEFRRKYINKVDLQGFVVCTDDFNYKIPFEQYDAIQWRIDSLLQKMSLKDIRFKLSQFRKQINLPTILTLRTKQQYGNYQSSNYLKTHKQIQKIPSQYIDSQITKIPFSDHIHNPLWSYHGSQTRWIQQMKLRKGIKKVILQPTHNLQLLQKRYSNDFDLFWSLGKQNRLTRLDSKIKMVSPFIVDGSVGIMTKSQFILLSKLLKLIK